MKKIIISLILILFIFGFYNFITFKPIKTIDYDNKINYYCHIVGTQEYETWKNENLIFIYYNNTIIGEIPKTNRYIYSNGYLIPLFKPC